MDSLVYLLYITYPDLHEDNILNFNGKILFFVCTHTDEWAKRL